MLIMQPCSCIDRDTSDCSGFISESEVQMAKMNGTYGDAQDYHEILVLFEKAFDIVEEERERSLKE